MKTKLRVARVILAGLVLSATLSVIAQESPRLSISPSGGSIELSWPATLQKSDGSIVRPYFEVQHSLDLNHWQPVGERQRSAAVVSGQTLTATLALDEPHAFYRLLVVEPRNSHLGSGGAEVFGYGETFAQELQRIGQISPGQFAAMFPSGATYLSGISWNPTTAQFWNQFQADPDVVNVGLNPGDPGYRTFDYRLNPDELRVFTNNGFMVSERLGSHSFADVFYKVWHNDLPVFISTDAILQAWHRTYDTILEEIEETYLFNGFETMLAAMAARVPEAWTQAGSGVLTNSILDADYFLAVARSLLAGTNVPPVPSVLGQDARVAATLADIQAEQMKTVDDFFGQCRVVDFSQFKVRGHYSHSERLGRYFKCVMWLGRTDLAVAGGPFDRGCCPVMAPPRELGTAIVLWRLLSQSGQFQAWVNFDRIIQVFVGWTDSMTFAQLGGVLNGAGIRSLADVPDLATLERLQADIVAGNLGVQNIRSDYFVSPLRLEQIQLPRVFTVFGQKFVPDSWAFSQTVYDNILWAENGVTNKVQRRVPSALDTAFGTLGNNQIVPELAARMANTNAARSLNHAEKWRDGLPYQHHLAAVRAVMDAQQPEAWESNIYMSWLAALRELSAPTTDPIYPEAMRTRAWAMKTLNTQLASWTQLRHNTVLFAKQSYTGGGGGCFYPAGFVEPRVKFWQRLRAAASRTADLISTLPYQGTYQVDINFVPLSSIQSNQVAHLRRFADTLATLQTLAVKELAQQPFSADEELFIRRTVEALDSGSTGYRARPPRYEGWYFGLFYRPIHLANEMEVFFQQTYGADAADQIVADVHTDVPNPDPKVLDPGSVLHEGIGKVNLLMIAIDNGADRMVFAGPVLSHYEFEVIGSPRRLNDEEWKAVLDGQFPSDVDPSRVEGLVAPTWTSGYLVPKH